MTEKKNRKLFRPFGPSIGGTVIPDDIIKKINLYVDDLIKDDSKAKKQDVGSSLAGNVKQEFMIEKDVMEKIGWGKFLATNVKEWIRQTKKRDMQYFAKKNLITN